jgi:hypothetical protein
MHLAGITRKTNQAWVTCGCIICDYTIVQGQNVRVQPVAMTSKLREVLRNKMCIGQCTRGKNVGRTRNRTRNVSANWLTLYH